MGTIVERRRKNGSASFLAKISIMRNGRIVHREHKTFDRRPAASAWITKRERELSLPGELERLNASQITVGHAIDRYVEDMERQIGRTKAQVLRSLRNYGISTMKCDRVRSQDIVDLARELLDGRQAQTVGNYISHLAAVFTVASAAWGYRLDPGEMDKARIVLARLGMIARSKQRDRRPTMEEINRLMECFEERSRRRRNVLPMHRVTAFAIFSTRRQEEIVRIEWRDFDEAGARVMVRDMKHPGDKEGNDQWCDLPPEAVAIIQSMPRVGARIFPFSTDAVSAAFTRACQLLEIDDLCFHDLRHDGISRLFEMGATIPKVACVSGHRSWKGLQRYTHVRQTGDKYAGWSWLPVVTETMRCDCYAWPLDSDRRFRPSRS